jgi:hypothetical protein
MPVNQTFLQTVKYVGLDFVDARGAVRANHEGAAMNNRAILHRKAKAQTAKRCYSVRGFLSDTRGNIAMMFILMSSLLFLFVGGSVDYARFNSVRADMLDSLDAASLSIARMEELYPNMTEADLVSYGEKFFVENADQEADILKPDTTAYSTISEIISFDLASDTTKVQACVRGKIKTYLLPVVNIKYLDIDQCVGITKFGAGRIELALVLDVTGSMNSNDSSGARKMTSLKSAVTAMLDVMFEGNAQSNNLKIGVVPFNTHVNAGGSTNWQAAWGDLNADSVYHGNRFFHVTEAGVVDTSIKVNHYNLFASDPDNNWEGCVEARPYPLDELDTPPGAATTTTFLSAEMATPSSSDEPDVTMRNAFLNMPAIDPNLTLTALASAANSSWVPAFIGDEPDCGNSDDCTYNHSGTSGGISWSGGWFDDPDNASGISESHYRNGQYIYDYRYTRYNIGTPFGKYVPIVDHFRQVAQGIISDPGFSAWLNSVGATDFTEDEFIVRNGYVGWWNSTDNQYDYKYDQPKGSSSDGPNPYDCPPPILALTDTRADIDGGDGSGGIIAGLPTTGYTNIATGAAWGWRVVSDGLPFTESTGPGDTGPDGTSEGDWQRAVVIMTDGQMNFSDRNTHWGSRPSSFGYEIESRMGDGIDEADGSGGTNGNMEDEAEYKLLRICRRMKQENILVYSIVFDVSVGSTVDTIMKSCATEPNQPYYYNAPNATDLEDAFSKIAADLVDLHISQ